MSEELVKEIARAKYDATVNLKTAKIDEVTKESNGIRNTSTYYKLAEKVRAISPPSFLDASKDGGEGIVQEDFLSIKHSKRRERE